VRSRRRDRRKRDCRGERDGRRDPTTHVIS
jgi:hypothetical protein